MPSSLLKSSAFWRGALHILPLCLATVPWGLLAGSMAFNSGLSVAQSLGMSAFIFAGAAQLVTTSMLAAGSGVIAIIITIFILTAQHFLYALVLREHVSTMPARKRVAVGFLLTDELFALSVGKKEFSFAYLLGAGLCFYFSWLLFSAAGIALAANVPDLAQYHLDFSIVATFVAIVVPMIKKLSTLVGVITSLILSLYFSSIELQGAMVLAGVLGMLAALLSAKLSGEKS